METGTSPGRTPGEGERYRTLLEINNAIISNLTQGALFRAIAGTLRRVVPFDWSATFLHEPRGTSCASCRGVLPPLVLFPPWPRDARRRQPRGPLANPSSRSGRPLGRTL
jgi:hypothetical protein